jgi:hypothetical protein
VHHRIRLDELKPHDRRDHPGQGARNRNDGEGFHH